MKAGYEVSFYARNKAKTEDVIAKGAVYHPTIPECVNGCDAVITIVGFPKDVREVYFGKDGILENVSEGTYVIDMTTSSPKLAEEIYEEAKKRGIHALDAPVTGGDVGAQNGTLSILAGGDPQAYEKCLPVFEAMGKNIHLEGKAGSGQHTKMVNQIMIAGTISGICEAFAYAKEKGLDIPTVLDSVATGAAGSKQLELQAAKMLEQDYAPGFFIKHFIKDMKLAKEEAEADGLTLKVLDQTLAAYEELEKRGDGELGTQALIKYFE